MAQQHDELVAPQARDSIVLPDADRQTLSNLDEHPIACLVVHRIVDTLETIDIDVGHPDTTEGGALSTASLNVRMKPARLTSPVNVS